LNSSFTVESDIPLYIILGTFIILIIFARWVYGKFRNPLKGLSWITFTLRSISFIIILTLLAELVFSYQLTISKIPVFKVFFDNSVSAAYHQSSSKEALNIGYREIYNSIINSSEENKIRLRVEQYSFGTSVETRNLNEFEFEFSEPSTNISEVLKQGNVSRTHDEFLAGMIIVTDGQVTSGDNPFQLISDIKVPVNIIGIGEKSQLVDVFISEVDAPTVGIIGDMINATIHLISTGSSNEHVNVTLSSGRKMIATKTLKLSGIESENIVKFQFPLTDLDRQEYTVRVSTLKDEINIENNKNEFNITSLKDRFRIAMLTGTLNPNTSILKNVLNSEETRFNLDHYVNFSSGWEPSIANFWKGQYDLIIFDNFPISGINTNFIAAFNKKQKNNPASLAFFAGLNTSGPSVKILYDVFEVQNLGSMKKMTDRYNIVISDVANSHPVFATDNSQNSSFVNLYNTLPPIMPQIFVEPSVNKLNIMAYLDSNPTVPLIILGKDDKYRTRQSIFTSSDLWFLHMKNINSHDGLLIPNWLNSLFHWLVFSGGESDAYFRLNKQVFQRGDEITIVGEVLNLSQTSITGGGVNMTVKLDNKTVAVYPLKYYSANTGWEGRYFASEPGNYSYTIECLNGDVIVGSHEGEYKVIESQIELNRVFLNEQLLSEVTQKTGGAFVKWSDRGNISNILNYPEKEITLNQEISVSHWMPLSILLIISLSFEWIFRRMIGLQ
tara:strand:- start:3138 stop:5312 length:2175 start_codon:yes stop_codon:yes gene_type:complete